MEAFWTNDVKIIKYRGTWVVLRWKWRSWCRPLLYYLFCIKNFYWNIFDLQCCVSFRYKAKWFSYTYTCIHSFSDSDLGFKKRTDHQGNWKIPSQTPEEISIGHFPVIHGIVKSEVKVAQSFMTLCNPIGHIIHGILQIRILEWVVFPFSRGSS